MPTGYTSDVQNGTISDFRTFALRCARAFGACILQRDDPMDAEPKHREPSEFYGTYLAEQQRLVAELEVMTPDEAERCAATAFTDGVAAFEKRERAQTEEHLRYRGMLERVLAWHPPTDGHDGLKKFMVQQLESSIDSDRYSMPYPKKLSGALWLATERTKAARGLANAEKSLREEQERCATANAWIDALKASL